MDSLMPLDSQARKLMHLDPKAWGSASMEAFTSDTLSSLNPLAWIHFLRLQGIPLDRVQTEIIHKALGALRTTFPRAIPDSILIPLLNNALASYADGFQPHTTLFGSSICPDEICHEVLLGGVCGPGKPERPFGTGRLCFLS